MVGNFIQVSLKMTRVLLNRLSMNKNSCLADRTIKKIKNSSQCLNPVHRSNE